MDSASCLSPAPPPGKQQDKEKLQNHSFFPPAAAGPLRKPPPQTTPAVPSFRGHSKGEGRVQSRSCRVLIQACSFYPSSLTDSTFKLASLFFAYPDLHHPTSSSRSPPASTLHHPKLWSAPCTRLPGAPTWDCACTQLSLAAMKIRTQVPNRGFSFAILTNGFSAALLLALCCPVQ